MLLIVYVLCFIAHVMIMDDHVNTFINHQNFTETNNLTYLLGNDDTIIEEIVHIFIDIQEFCEKLYNVESNLSIVSLNVQSIKAKFDEFRNEFRNELNEINKKHHISIICIQESWLSSECCSKMFELPNYQLISQGKYCSNHGGFLICMFIMITTGNLLQ